MQLQIPAPTQTHPFPREMSLDSKLSAGYMVLSLIFVLVRR